MIYNHFRDTPDAGSYPVNRSELLYPEFRHGLEALFYPQVDYAALRIRDLADLNRWATMNPGSSTLGLRRAPSGGLGLYCPGYDQTTTGTFSTRMKQTTNWTLWGWFVPARLAVTFRSGIIDIYATAAGTYHRILAVTNTAYPAIYYPGISTIIVPADGTISTNVPCQMVGTGNSGTVRLWVNGVLQTGSGTDTGSGWGGIASGKLMQTDGGYSNLNGWLLGAGVWNYPLPDRLIQQLWADPLSPVRPRRRVYAAAVAGAPPEGSAVLTAVGSLAADGKTVKSGYAAASGVGGLAAAGAVAHSASGILSAVGAAFAAGATLHSGSAAASSVGALLAEGRTSAQASATLTAIGSLLAVGDAPTEIPEGSAIASGVGSLVAATWASASGAAGVSGVGSLTVAGSRDCEASAVVSAAGVLAAVGVATGGVARPAPYTGRASLTPRYCGTPGLDVPTGKASLRARYRGTPHLELSV